MHQLNQDGEDVKMRLIDQSSNSLRIKVRMTTRRLKELMAQTDLSKGNSELGRMIMQECLESRLCAYVVPDQDLVSECAWTLSTIKEE